MAARKTKTIVEETHPLEIDGIPTAWGLTKQGRHLAYTVPRGIHITAEGHAVIGAALKAKAEEAIARGEHIWVRPPSAENIFTKGTP